MPYLYSPLILVRQSISPVLLRRYAPMKRLLFLMAIFALTTGTMGCSMAARAVSGGAIGAGAGFAIGGPIGAGAGAAVGAVTGAVI